MPDIEEVGRQLVGEARGAVGPVMGGAREVGLADRGRIDRRRSRRPSSGSITTRDGVPANCLTASGIACSSPADPTSRCEERIRSTSVVPVRGMPTTNIGAGIGIAAAAGGKALAPLANNASIASKIAASCAKS